MTFYSENAAHRLFSDELGRTYRMAQGLEAWSAGEWYTTLSLSLTRREITFNNLRRWAAWVNYTSTGDTMYNYIHLISEQNVARVFLVLSEYFRGQAYPNNVVDAMRIQSNKLTIKLNSWKPQEIVCP